MLKSKPLRVVGAGIAGLLAGFFLKKRGFDFEIIEQASVPGGLLGTRKMEHGLAEQAANGFLWCSEMQEVADGLGLEVIGPLETAKKRFLVRGGKLRRYPLSVSESLVMAGKAILPHRTQLQTAADFGKIYFGAAFNRQLLGPGLAGIYGARPEELSFPGALSSVAKIMNQSDSLPLALLKNRRANKVVTPAGKKPLGTHSFKAGMGALVESLTEHLKDHLRLDTDGLHYKDAGDPLLITIPAPQSKHFFSGRLYELLDQVKYTPLITTTLFFHKKDLVKYTDGFGCLIPRNEGLQILGVLFNSSIFPHRSNKEEIVSLTCILRDDTPQLDLFALPDEGLQDLLVSELDQLFGVQAPPLEYSIFRWRQAIPLYSPTLYKNWFEMDSLLQTEYPNRHLFGNYTGQISVRGMCQSAWRIGN